MARPDVANKSNFYPPLNIPACGSYSCASCGLTTDTLNHTSPKKHNVGTTSSIYAANAGSTTNVSNAVLSKHVNALVNSPFSAHDIFTFTTHEASDSSVYGQPAAAFVSSDASVQFANPVKNKSQFQNGIRYSISWYNTVRASGAAATKGSSNKKFNFAPQKCRICSSINRVCRRKNVENVCESCWSFFNRHSLEEIESFFPCVEVTKRCDTKFIGGKRIPCNYCRFMKCLDERMTK